MAQTRDKTKSPESNTDAVDAGWTAPVLIVLVAAIVAAAWSISPEWGWVLVVALMMTFIFFLGKVTTGRGFGILINQRKLMSLSRFQLVLWTVIIISAYFVIAMVRVKSGEVADPLAIQIDWQVWTLLGISAASFVGTPLLMGNKKRKEPADQGTIEKSGRSLRMAPDLVDQNREGILYGNPGIDDARFTDMFEGDEIKDTAYIDIAKLQLFFFTIMVAAVYCAEVLQLLTMDDLLADDLRLPVLSEGMLTLMGISHAGYLGNKGIDHTPSA